MQIRFFSTEDTESTVDLLHDMSVHYNGSDASSREAVRSNLIENILGPSTGVRLVIALDGHRVAGLAAISLLYPAPKERAQLFMKELYVHSADRGAGIGRRLMSWLARYAIDKQCVRFDWTVDESNTESLRFYNELGATHVKDKLYFRFTGASLNAFAAGDTRDALPPQKHTAVAILPKYSAAEIERRWFVDLSQVGSLTALPRREIEDLYIAGTHMRLRKVSAEGEAVIFKLGKKYGKGNNFSEQVVSVYLTEVEFNVMATMPGTVVKKSRYTISGGALDVYQNPISGFAIFEAEFQSESDAMNYTPPNFTSKEITHSVKYSGFALSQVAG